MSNPSKNTLSEELLSARDAGLEEAPLRPHYEAGPREKERIWGKARKKAERFARKVERSGNSDPSIIGAMDGYDLPSDIVDSLDTIRMKRLRAIQELLIEAELPGIFLFNPVNARYATDTTDMTLFCSHFETRYVYIPADTKKLATIVDYAYLPFLSEDIPSAYPATSEDVFPAYYYFAAAQNADLWAQKFAEQISGFMWEYARGENANVVAVDGLSQLAVKAIENIDSTPHQFPYQVVNAQKIIEQARAIKSDDEIRLIQYGLDKVCWPALQTINEITDALPHDPEVTENYLFSKMAQQNLEQGGQWLETRRITSGSRTWPEFREASWKVLRHDELINITTDMVSCFGYQINCGRTWVINPINLNSAYKTHYREAYAQIQHNMGNLIPGHSFEWLSQNSYPVANQYRANQTPVIYQGVGMSNTWPTIPNTDRWADHGYSGRLLPGMLISVQSYISSANSNTVDPWGIRLETMVHVTENGPVELKGYQYDPDLLS